MKTIKAQSTSNDGNQKGCLGCHGLLTDFGAFQFPLDTGLFHTHPR